MHECKVKSQEGGYPNVQVEPNIQNLNRKFCDGRRLDRADAVRG